MKPPRIALPRLRLPRPQLRLRLPAPASARPARLPPDSGPMRLLRPWHWALAGMLSGLLLTSILFAPARWLASAVAYASNEQLQLQDASGTVWNGSAWLVLTGGSQSRDATTLPSRLQWQLRPRLTGARVTLESDCCTRQPLQLDLDWPSTASRAAACCYRARANGSMASCASVARPVPMPARKRPSTT